MEIKKLDERRLKKGQALEITVGELIDKYFLGMWVSSEYTSPSYEAECISPKAFWHEWSKLKNDILSSKK